MFTLQRIVLLFILFSISLLTGCSTTKSNPAAALQNVPECQIFQQGEHALYKRRYPQVIKYFEALDTLYPFGTYSEQADLQLIYDYYQHDDIPLAEAAADRFIRLYPRSCYVDYAYYMKGLADFEQDRGWVQKYFPTDLTQRDPGAARQAFNDFGILVRLFPTSYYAPDARQHMVYIRNLSAAYEFHVACFYYKRGAFVAAANRCSYIMQHYDGTPAEYSALTMLMHCYQILGLPDLAAQVNQVWQYNQG